MLTMIKIRIRLLVVWRLSTDRKHQISMSLKFILSRLFLYPLKTSAKGWQKRALGKNRLMYYSKKLDKFKESVFALKNAKTIDEFFLILITQSHTKMYCKVRFKMLTSETVPLLFLQLAVIASFYKI